MYVEDGHKTKILLTNLIIKIKKVFTRKCFLLHFFIKFQKDLIYQFIFKLYMTMSCLRCGNLMIWLNGSISHVHDTNYYECKNCKIKVIKYSDDKITEIEE